MNQLLSLGVVFISSLSIGSGEECCQRKQVGEHVYIFVRSEDTSGYGCISGCAYTRDGAPGSLYCFKSGMLESACQDDHCKSAAEDKPKEINTNCTVDRDCSKWKPQQCVLDLEIETRSDIAVDGRPRTVLAYNGQIPGPPIVLCEGDELVVHFKNSISGNMTNIDGSTNTTTLHFHGIREKSRPWSDGVPFVTECPIQPGDPTFHYGFNASCVDGAPPGTYWYHSHVGSQRTNGAYGALIIKERKPNVRFVDDAANSLVLQEWYESSTNQVPVSLLINGKGRAGKYIHSGDNNTIDDYLKGKGGVFQTVPNIHYTDNFITNYHIFPVNTNTSYRFRIIGAISQNFPLKLSIEDHTFTAIAVDSLPIQPVHGLTAVWLAAGERYDIVVKTKTKTKTTPRVGDAYKIRVSGYARPRYLANPLCTIAWLKYPEQSINTSYICNPEEDLPQPPTQRTLNPVPNNFSAWDSRLQYPAWNDTTKAGDVFIVDLRAPKPEPTIHFHSESNLNTHYIAFEGDIAFNGKKMTYPDIPFLLQDPANISERCGGSECIGEQCTKYPKCNGHDNNTLLTQFDCNCQHVIKEPWSPGNWAEFVLINNYNAAVAHPIHQHGGWYWVVGMGKYGLTGTNHISREFIMNEDKKCPKKRQCLKRNFDNPPAKDTIQVPQNGYVIIRTKLDNAGTWIFHCHINHHVELGMAMVLQIGGLGEGLKNGLQGPWGKSQEWSTGPLKRNVKCKTKPNSIYGSLNTIEWFIGMKPAHRCVAPGEDVSFLWRFGHNVNQITETEYRTCNIIDGNQDTDYGGYVFTAPNTTVPKDYYFACGVGGGYHCKYYDMNAKITVSNKCN